MTRVFERQDKLHDAFKAFNVVHDDCKSIYAYPASDNQTDDASVVENEEEKIYVYPLRFSLYELTAQPGQVYAAAPTALLRHMFSRHRETYQAESAVFKQRVVDISALEPVLKSETDAETVGYAFRNVQSNHPISRLAVEGMNVDTNEEVQDIKGRADEIKSITFDLQTSDRLVRVRISEDGSVGFTRDLGDHTALTIVNLLESYISKYSELTSRTVGKRRHT